MEQARFLEAADVAGEAPEAPEAPMGTVILEDLYNPKLVDLLIWPEYYEDMLGDVREEAQLFGEVIDSWADETGQTAHAWLKFAAAAEAQSFQRSMHQRWFAGQVIRATLRPDSVWIDVSDL